ncbi:conidial pigment biosynthesis oxidase Abr1/brown 1 [Talaromyces proteolyticus]|uniref:Conidial pigment biosynthesis oxidase Abr1/brown 1 n=1 Tax=Talaromyces proteolyticus TaxID=1131652 RepID=A0AAD4L0X5_9EURO|nr:conidial pigment biosynthesis oxidase Abr1/brown 1 [Talaromyces proteolyticus]KAH8702101.1 conidial pigment biosynthesis oxidase Abr1/brown 1 [Talaromyces proteolyticus]
MFAYFSFLLLAGLAQFVAAKDVYFHWNITWVNASPDGYERPVIGINGEWPCPQIDVDVGDRLIIDVKNSLGNQSTGIHWHGIHQFMTGTMDGASAVTQCPVAPGSMIRYDFVVDQAGTYWYHSHNMGQYPDGLRGALIVHDPNPPVEYDDEFTITLADWYHKQMPELLDSYQSTSNTAGDEPLPDVALINDSTQSMFKVQPNTTYLVHIICIGNWPGHAFLFDDHEMTVVEVDGTWIEPYPVGEKNIRVATGQRMSVLIKTKEDASKNYAFWNTMDINMMFVFENKSIPENFNPNATAWLVYDESLPLPEAPVIHELAFIDDLSFVPYDREPLLEPVDHQIILNTGHTVVNDVTRFSVNGQTYMPQQVPTLYTALTVGSEYNSDPKVYGNVNPLIINNNDVIEIVINNHHGNLHPWHLHGHQFQVLQRTDVNGGFFDGYFANISSTPVKRDTIMVQNYGHTVIRFRANNPGIWLLHCHIEWHVQAGLVATIIEAPDKLQELVVPEAHLQICDAYGSPSSGNAAGKKGEDLTGGNDYIYPGESGASYPPPTFT